MKSRIEPYSFVFYLLIVSYAVTFFMPSLVEGYGANLYFGVLNHEIYTLAAGFLLSVLCVVQQFALKRAICLSKGLILLLGGFGFFVIWIVFCQMWSVNPEFGWKEVRIWLGYLVILCAITYQLSAGPRTMRYYFLGISGVLTLLLSISIVYNYYLHGAYVPYIVQNLNRSILGEILILSIPLLLVGGLCIRGFYGRILCVTGILGYIAVVIMAQRAPLYGLWMGLIVGCIALFIRFKSKRKKILRLMAVLILLTLFFLIPHSGTGNLESWDTSRRAYNVEQALDTFSYRVTGALACYFQFKDNLSGGTGQGTFAIVFPQYHAQLVDSPLKKYSQKTADNQFSRAHCEPAQVAGELGLPGILIWLFIFVLLPLMIGLHGWKTRQPLLLMGIAGLMAFSISSLVSSFGMRIATAGIPLLCVYVLLAGGYRSAGKIFKLKSHALKILSVILLILSSLILSSLINNARAMHYLGLVEATKDNPQATYRKKMIHYSNMVKMDPSNPVFPYMAASTMAQHANLANEYSAELWRRAIDLGLFSVDFVIVESYAYWLRGEQKMALSRIDEALLVYPDSWRLLIFKAAYIERLEGPDAGDIYWQEALDNNPTAVPPCRAIIDSMMDRTPLDFDRKTFFNIPDGFYSLLNNLYFNSFEDQRRLPKLLHQQNKELWQ